MNTYTVTVHNNQDGTNLTWTVEAVDFLEALNRAYLMFGASRERKSEGTPE